MRRFLFANLVIVAILLSGCKDISPLATSDGDYIVFGSFYGECFGEQCVEIFKYEDGILYEDSLDRYPSINQLPYTGKYYKIENKFPVDIEKLRSDLPLELLSSKPTVFGIPDAYDQGGMIIQIKVEGEYKYWLLDTNPEALPEYLRDYAAELKSVISKIRD